MSASTYNILIEQGATFNLPLIVSSSSGAFNLSGYTARGQVRNDYNSTKLIDFTVSSSYASDGILAIQLTATQTATLPAGSARYDLELVTGSDVTRLLQGSVTVSPNVTK